MLCSHVFVIHFLLNNLIIIELVLGEDARENNIKHIQFNNTIDYGGFSPISVENETVKVDVTSETNIGEVSAISDQLISPPPPPPPPAPPAVYFTGYTLPPGNPCEGFTLPPPSADPKRTGPRRK